MAIIEVSVDEIRLLQDCIFDELMRSMFNIISRLKLAPSLKQNNIEMVSIKPDPVSTFLLEIFTYLKDSFYYIVEAM